MIKSKPLRVLAFLHRSFREADFQRELDAREALVDGGIVWGEDFSNEDRDAFVSVVTEIWEKLAEEAGGNAPAYRERVLTALGR